MVQVTLKPVPESGWLVVSSTRLLARRFARRLKGRASANGICMELEIPQEIVDRILDELQDDIPTLKICSLVSRSFLPTCRRHIYSTLDLMYSNPAKHSGKIKFAEDILSRNPDIAPLIHHFKVTITRDFPISILTQLSRLRSLTIQRGGFQSTPADLESTIFTIFQSNLLVSITVADTFDIPISIFCACPQLKVLRLHNVTDIAKRNILPSLSDAKNGQLIHLDLTGSSTVIPWLIQCLHNSESALRIDHLRFFDSSVHHDDEIDYCQQVINLSAATIERLGLYIDDGRREYPETSPSVQCS